MRKYDHASAKIRFLDQYEEHLEITFSLFVQELKQSTATVPLKETLALSFMSDPLIPPLVFARDFHDVSGVHVNDSDNDMNSSRYYSAQLVGRMDWFGHF